MRRFVILLVLCGLWCVPALATTDDITASPDSSALKVLFVGNSLTFFHSLPNTVATFIEAGAGGPSRVSDVVAPGYTLHQHWNDGIAQRKISDGGPWDVVVLQGKSMESYEDRWNFIQFGKRFANLVRKAHAKPVLYETFANKGKPQIQPKIHASYFKLADEVKAEVIPVGDVFYFVQEKDPSLELWDPDKLHPTALGTYLAGCVFYEYLTHKSPIGLPATIPSHAVPDQGYSVKADEAERLQQLAWQFFSGRDSAH